ncbi:hypothetical protein RSal33209_3303 [Renibacterium salmoninarum ATCC 33209]|uniref:DNA alkylation repair enzyme n=2 Tax=Renibacterium salmoninarum TaxID=1646 RepID=A9WUZ5_RENSM|nr:hypothetical protein RSal33209_3303 [Renibacterium salmoninarum ATCC 33209]
MAMFNDSFTGTVRDALEAQADAERAKSMAAYMKSYMPYRGVPKPQVRKIMMTAARAYPFADAADLLSTATKLWREANCREERYIATALTEFKLAKGNLDFLPFYEEVVSAGAWWDHVDEMAHRILDLLLAHGKTMDPKVRQWSTDSGFWFRRLAIISQLHAKTSTDLGLLSDVIEPNMADPEFFVRKAIGWALRDYARTDPDWVRRFVAERSAALSPLSQREALKHLS